LLQKANVDAAIGAPNVTVSDMGGPTYSGITPVGVKPRDPDRERLDNALGARLASANRRSV
jgi:hypothetical protein